MMMHVAMAIVVTLSGVLGGGGSGEEKPRSYAEAYKIAQEENRPLVVLVGADWCPACVTMKSQTIEPLKESGQLQDVVYAHVDKDSEPELARKLMDGNTLPQIVVYAKSESGWKRFSLTGLQSKGRVRDLIRKAASVLPGVRG